MGKHRGRGPSSSSGDFGLTAAWGEPCTSAATVSSHQKRDRIAHIRHDFLIVLVNQTPFRDSCRVETRLGLRNEKIQSFQYRAV